MYKKYVKRTKEEYDADNKAACQVLFDKIADSVLEELENDKHIWEMPWLKNPENGMPENVRGHKLRGDNFWLCLFKQYEFKKRQLDGEDIPNPTGKWYTFVDIKKMNEENLKNAVNGEKPEFIHIRKGEQATCLTKFMPKVKKKEEEQEQEEDFSILVHKRQEGRFGWYKAFNSCQIVGLPEEKIKEYDHSKEALAVKEKEMDVVFETLSKSLGVPIKHETESLLGGFKQKADKAYYSVTGDYIVCPPKEMFRSLSEYYGTLFHEFAHATGADTRLKRFHPEGEEKTKREGWSQKDIYSEEEIIAEFTACYLAKHFKTDIDLSFKNNVAYMAIWKGRLKKDRGWLQEVMKSASKAADMIINNSRFKTLEDKKSVDLTPEEKVKKNERVLTA